MQNTFKSYTIVFAMGIASTLTMSCSKEAPEQSAAEQSDPKQAAAGNLQKCIPSLVIGALILQAWIKPSNPAMISIATS